MQTLRLSITSLVLAAIIPFSSVFAQGIFSDIADTHTNIDAISYVQEKGIVQGYDDGTFKPGSAINRAEFTKILMEAVFDADEIEECTEDSFSDIRDEWFAKYVCIAKKQDIVSGYPDGEFKPGNDISFVEAAKMIANGFKMYTINTANTWYRPYVDALGARAAIPTDISSFDMKITRGQMAEMIYRIHAKVTTKPSLNYGMIGDHVVLPDGRYDVQVTGGTETLQVDGGRPLNLIAGALEVAPEVFREAFSKVTPEENGHLTPETAQRNKSVLLPALEPYGVTNDRLDTVTNYYRYRADLGEMWPVEEAKIAAVVKDGTLTFDIVEHGSGYNSVPTLKIDEFPDMKLETTIMYDTDFSNNGSIESIAVVQE